MSKRTVDSGKLNDLFDIDESSNSFFSSETDVSEILEADLEESELDGAEESIIESIDIEENSLENEKIDPDVDYINKNLKDMVGDVKDIIAAAKYLIDSSPDDATISAASQLFASAVGLLRELNKGVLQTRKERHDLALEKLKIKARKELAAYKIEHRNPLGAIGTGNTINIDNRSISFSQEAVVSDLLKARQKLEQKED